MDGAQFMKVAGIVAEFNPFHRGHEYIIEQTKRALGDDSAVICAMSGNFVQRGDCAILRKQARAECAVRCGADLVLELPLPWAIASAESFAAGAVELLRATGIVTHLSFGSESGDVSRLEAGAQALALEETQKNIRALLQSGMPYAQARQLALERTTGQDWQMLSRPNNILGVEYLKAIRAQGGDIQPMTVTRVGAEHDGAGDGVFFSASEVRRRSAQGEDVLSMLPEESAKVFAREIELGRAPLTMEKLELALMSRLRMLPLSEFQLLPDATEGLGDRLYEAVCTQPGVEQILTAAKTRRYAMSRLRRMLLCACLGVRAGDREGGIPYIKILAMSQRGRELLRKAKERATLPIITKPAAVKQLSSRAQHIFALEAASSDLLMLACDAVEERYAGSDYRSSPFVLE
jgi:predicted nucleotidyltransferase